METKSIENLEFGKVLNIIASFAGSQAAKEKILSLFPSKDIEIINTILSEADEFLAYAERGVRFQFGGIRDIRDVIGILKADSHILCSEDFMKVSANIRVAGELRKSFDLKSVSAIPNNKGLILNRIKNLPKLSLVGERIGKCLDDKGEVRSNASPILSGIRRESTQTKQKIEKQLQAFINSHSDDMQDSFFTIRNERYVLPISASAQSRIQGIVHDQSSTGQTVFIEPLEFLPVNNRIAQLKLSEKEEIKRIFKALTELLCQSAVPLEMLFETIVHFDFLNAKIRFFNEYDCVKPEISDTRELKLVSARHPLIHPDCVPLDVQMDAESQCIVITGPNGGGKTVTLKTIGLSALLMQSGLFIPANSGSKLPIFSNILVDIGESQSIEDHLSTFTSHLKRLKEMYDNASSDALILIDEICVGTDPDEGSALASGFLKQIVRKGNMAVVTSHYDSLKQMAFTTDKFMNSAMEFDYKTFKPTFRFRMGVPGRSNALAMARTFGLPEEILTELGTKQTATRSEEARLLEAIEQERNRAEALRRTYVKKLGELRINETEVNAGLKKLKEFRKTKRDQLTEKYSAELRAKLKELERVIHNLKVSADNQAPSSESDSGNISGNSSKGSLKNGLNNRLGGSLVNSTEGSDSSEQLKEAREAHKMARNTLQSLDIPAIESFKSLVKIEDLSVGDDVVWRRMQWTGNVSSIDVNKNRVVIDFDGKIMQVPVSEITPKNKNKKTSSKISTGSVYARRPEVKSEVDLRGLRVEEAIEKTDEYLKNAEIQGFGKVYLIHGKGTGALQKAIEAFLKSGPYRKKFRLGRHGEGDLGVTVVVFNEAADKTDEDFERSREKLLMSNKTRSKKIKKKKQ